MTDERSVNVLVEHLFRRHAGQMLSSLGRLLGFGQIELAEEAVQDALVRALHVWTFQGVPPNPEAWLTQVARNRLLDLLRTRARHRRKLPDLEALAAGRTGPDPAGRLLDGEPDDDRLAMTFACCHPALPAVPDRQFGKHFQRSRRRIVGLVDMHVDVGVEFPGDVEGNLDMPPAVRRRHFVEGHAAHDIDA